MEFKVKETKILTEGQYTGVIKQIKESDNTSEFQYIDVLIEEPTQNVISRCGFPADISITQDGKPSSSFAKFLSEFKISLGKDANLSLETINNTLLGKQIKFSVVKKGDFYRVERDSLKSV